MKYIDKLAWLRVEDNKILVTRSFGKDTYYLPGGKRDSGESDTDALIREIHEELSVELIQESVEHACTFEAPAHGKAEGSLVRMTCYWADFTGELAVANEIEAMGWFDYSQKGETSQVDGLIFDWLHERDFI